MTDIFNVERRIRTKTDAAYADLRRMIVTSEIGPNDDLEEHELTVRYGHGRTPIREALKRLAHERFIIWPPRRSPRIARLDATEMQRLYEARLVLEQSIARYAAARITDAQLSLCEELIAKIEDAVRSNECYLATEYDHAFHVSVARGAGNSFMADAVSNLNCAALPMWYRAHQVFGISSCYDHHVNIIDGLRTRDGDRASAAVEQHVQLSYSRQLRMLELSLGDPTQPGHPPEMKVSRLVHSEEVTLKH